MIPLPSSSPSPASSQPSLGSWRRSDLTDALRDAEGLRAVLRRIELVESGSAYGAGSRACRKRCEDLVDALSDLHARVPLQPALPLDVPGDEQRRP